MYCSNCGSQINPGESFCKMCGQKIASQQMQNDIIKTPFENQFQQTNTQNQGIFTQNINQPINNFNQVNQSNYFYDADDDLVNAYISKNVNEIRNGGFSFCTFFFGSLYVLYRKMWLLGILWFFCSIVISFLLPTFSYIITLVASIVISMQFKNLYINNVEEKVEEIKRVNPGKSKEQLIVICNQKGGTTWLPVVIFLILIFIMIVPIIVFLIDSNKKETLASNIEQKGNLVVSDSADIIWNYQNSKVDNDYIISFNLDSNNIF